MDVGLKRELEEKVRSGERLSREDGIALYESDDLAWLGGLAHEVRTRKNGDVVHFNVNRHLNMTNVCTASCAYCSFQRKPGEKDAYTMRIEEAVKLAKEMESENLTELHIVNGLHPNLPWRYYPRSLRELKAALPDVSLKAFTATEIHHFETISGLSASEILDELIDAGLESLTGGGAEIFDWEVRQHIVDHRTHWEDWSRIHRLAHEKGLKTPCTMLYGHIEEPRHRVDHVLRLRELQDETGGFQVFIPLRYQHDFVDMKDGKVRNRLQARTQMATGAEALKTFAVSRLLFDNVPHVKVFWVMHGVQTAQLALRALGVSVHSHVLRIGSVVAPRRDDLAPEDFAAVDESPVRCLDADASAAMVEEIDQCRRNNESLGGEYEVRAFGLVPGIGSHTSWEERLDGRLAQAIMSIQAMKGVGIGDGFDLAGRVGSEAHDEIFWSDESGFFRETNRAGGLEGGMTTGDPVVVSAAMKPLPTLTKPLRSVDIATKEPAQALRERTDSCTVPAAGVVGEAMVALVIASAYREKFGGDHLDDGLAALDAYRRRIGWKR